MARYVFSVFTKTKKGVDTHRNLNKEDALAEAMLHLEQLLERGEILGFFIGVEESK